MLLGQNLGGTDFMSLHTCKGEIDYSKLGQHMVVPVYTSRVPEAEVVWINKNYFLKKNINIFLESVVDDLKREMLETYAVEAADDEINKGSVLYADRYGASVWGFHGGSGRAASLGIYNAKGIGRTTLVSSKVDRVHCDGYMSIVEAIRETICSEVAAAELPHSAIPVLAIIDLKRRHHFHNGEYARAIIIRSNFIRPAHFERSVFFGSSGNPESDQFLDALRVKSIINNEQFFPLVSNIRLLFDKFCEQIGAARALRLWQGQFTSSNISIDGKMVDFGSFRGIAHWHKSYGEVGETFGTDKGALMTAANSIYFYLKKYRNTEIDGFSFNEDYLENKIHETFTKFCADGLANNLNEEDKACLLENINIYFQEQQSRYVKVDHKPDLKLPWIYSIINRNNHPTSNFSKSALKIKNILLNNMDSEFSLTKFWLKPRVGLFYNISNKKISNFVKNGNHAPLSRSSRLANFISNQVLQNRRSFPNLELKMDLIAYTAGDGFFVYVGKQGTDETVMIIDCYAIDNTIYFLDNSFEFELLESHVVKRENNQVRLKVDVNWRSIMDGEDFLFFGKKLKIDSWHYISRF